MKRLLPLLPLAFGLGACVKLPDIEVLPATPTPASSARRGASLHKDEILTVIRANRAQIRDCYEKRLESAPNLQGKVAIKFVIADDGQVKTSSVHDSTVGDAELEGCVATRVGTWRFPAPRGGGIVVVTYPFTFKASNEG